MRILGVIPARSGSKDVIKKNLRIIEGKHLIEYIIETAHKVDGIDDLIVSTDSEEIAKIAEKRGVKVPFLRPLELAGDEVPLVAVSRHALNFFDENIYKPDAIVSLQPTSPLLSFGSIKNAVTLYRTGEYDSVVSVTKISHFHPFRTYKIEGTLVKPLTEYTSEKYLQKQDRPSAYGFTGGLYLRKRDLLEKWNRRDFALGDKVGGVVVSEEEAIDIDSELDLLFFETILRYKKEKEL